MDQRGDWRLTDALDYEHGRGDPFAAAVRATRMPMVITNPRLPDNPIVFCNEAFQALTGYGRDEIVGRNCRFLQGDETDRAEVARVRAAITDGQDVEANLLNYRKDGTAFWNALYLSPVRTGSGEISYFFASQLDVTDRVASEQRAAAQRREIEREVAERTAELRQALDAKTVLLHELDHRVKNNLTMIGSLLRLQARSAGEPAISGRLAEMTHRVDALGAVHRRLFQSADATRFELGGFLADLAAELAAGAGPDRIGLVADIEPVEVAHGHASALGLVLNEIVSNAIKHGFPDGRAGTLRVRTASEDDTIVIEVADDGPGMPEPAGTGFGRMLIERLSRQFGATASWTSASPGTVVRLCLPMDRVT